MPQLFDISKVAVGPRNLEAVASVAPGAPLMTSDDPEGTERVLEIMPGLSGHLCLGDASSSFGEVARDTELAHLLEHVTVELLAQTNAAGDVTGGQTVEVGERTYKITLACPDDVLVAGALSSAVWILQWAYSGGGEPVPDVEAIASGLVDLVGSLGAPEMEQAAEEPAEEPVAPGEGLTLDGAWTDAPEPAGAPDLADGAALDPLDPLAAEDAPAPAALSEEPAAAEDVIAPVPTADDMPAGAESAADPDPMTATDLADEPAPAAEKDDPWQMKDVPRPHLVR